MTTVTKWIVACEMGCAKNPEFDNEDDAFARHRKESAIPSYIHPETFRKSRVIKVTMITKDVTPPNDESYNQKIIDLARKHRETAADRGNDESYLCNGGLN